MTNCTIVGGGLIGMLAARELSAAGARVRLLERGIAGREASWAGGGILSPLYPWRYSDSVTRLAAWGQDAYPQLAAELAEETGTDPEWTRSGLLVLEAGDERDAEEWAARQGVRLERVDAHRARELEPGLDAGGPGGLWLSEVAQVRNPRLVRALRESLLRRGVDLREDTPVQGLRCQDGRIIGVDTPRGTLEADTVIVAGGAWTAALLAPTGLELPVVPVRGQMLLFRAVPEAVRRIVLSRDHYLIPRRDGRVLVGSTLEQAGFDKSTTVAARAELIAEARRLLPALAEFPVEHHWAGLRPGSPDGVPYIGPHPRVAGLYVSAGHYRNGVVLGPASARLLADLVLGRPPVLDPAPYLPGRDPARMR